MKNDDGWLITFEPCQYSDRLLDKLISINKSSSDKHTIDILEIKKAVYYAKKYHGEQKRQSGEPYYSHPLEVAYMLADYASVDNRHYFRTDLIVSSILHDTIEDTELTQVIIAEIFGENVASQVEGLTRIKAQGKITSEELVYSLLAQKNKDVLMVKMFDRLHNVQTITSKSPEKIKKIIDETVRVFLFLSVYLDMPQIKNILISFCYEHLRIKRNVYSLVDITSAFSANNYHLPSLKPRNDANQGNTL